MARYDTWDPWNIPVQGGMKEGKFASSTHTLIAAGPPHLADIPADAMAESVFPIGICQDFTWGQTKGVARFYEIGSKRSYVLTGHAAGGVTLTEVYYSGPSLLRKLYGVWPDWQGKKLYNTNAAENSGNNPDYPATPYIAPGYNNFLYNMQSDFFDRPFGLLLIVRTNLDDVLIQAYFEEAVVPGYNIAFNAQGVVLQESCTVDYERVIPVASNYDDLLSGIRTEAY